jgi:sulfur carrier protein ThiS
MRVTLKLYAALSDHLPTDEARNTNAFELNVKAGTTVATLIRDLSLPLNLCHLVLVDGIFVPPGARASWALVEGNSIAIWPPIAGG